MKNKKLLFVVALCTTLFGCGRTKIEEIHNCVIVNQHCGFDNLDAGYYHVKDLTTNVVYRIDVNIQDCNVFNIGDTIK